MVYVLLGKGFEETEAIAPVDLLRRANISVLTVGIGGNVIAGSHNIPAVADITIEEMDLTQMEMIVLPGGLGGVASILGCKEALDAITFAYEPVSRCRDDLATFTVADMQISGEFNFVYCNERVAKEKIEMLFPKSSKGNRSI